MSHVQGTGGESSGAVTSLAIAFSSNVVAGRTLLAGVVGFKSNASNAAITTVEDSLGNTWTELVELTTNNVGSGDDSVVISIWAAERIATGGACTVTATPDSAQFMGMVIAEVFRITHPLSDVAATGAGGTTADTGNLTTTDLAYIFGIATHDDSTTRVITPGGSQTQIFEDEAITGMPVNGTYRIEPTAGDYNSTWTITSLPGTEAWFCAQAVLQLGNRWILGPH